MSSLLEIDWISCHLLSIYKYMNHLLTYRDVIVRKITCRLTNKSIHNYTIQIANIESKLLLSVLQ